MATKRQYRYLLAMLLVMALPVVAQNSSSELNASFLDAVGLHLPSYMRMPDLMKYQDMFPTHQTIVVERAVDPDNPSGVVFSLASRDQGRSGSPGSGSKTINANTLVAVAVTSDREIRAISVLAHTVDSLRVDLPDDSKISDVVFLEPDSRDLRLRRVGEVVLQNTSEHRMLRKQ